jgi:geranylgeranyl pyrophosphate synthase
MINEVNDRLKKIFNFLADDLELLENELKKGMFSVTENKIDLHNVFRYFFDIKGKRLRPILVMLSAGSISNSADKDVITKLAAAMELIHNSSLIHDDIVDESNHRRGQVTLNHKFNNKIAVLAGDLLYSQAYLIINSLNLTGVSEILSECVVKMSRSEISEIISPYSNFEEYIQLCDAKTAVLMSACCQCAAKAAGATKTQLDSLKDFGTNFGIAYQLTDDLLDNEQPKSFDVNLQLQAKIYAEKARRCLNDFPENNYKKHLLNLVHYVTDKVNAILPKKTNLTSTSIAN